MAPEDEPTAPPADTGVNERKVDGDDLSDDDRAELHAAIIAAERECDEGQALTEEEFWTRLRKAE